MTEKIEWYREVLELEPNSKVFLPLAKLLVEENGDSQAIDILQRGLDRHPDFLEARLFLIELLYKTGKNDERDAEVKKLGKMFATYAGFFSFGHPPFPMLQRRMRARDPVARSHIGQGCGLAASTGALCLI